MLGRPGGLRSDQLDTERVREPARDLALQDKQIVRVAVEPIRPSPCAWLRAFCGAIFEQAAEPEDFPSGAAAPTGAKRV